MMILNVPLALIGGVLGLWATGQYLSVPAAIGFIALFGIAMQDAKARDKPSYLGINPVLP